MPAVLSAPRLRAPDFAKTLLAAGTALLLSSAWAAGESPSQALGEKVFATYCTGCHEAAVASRAPDRQQLAGRTPESVVESLERGIMAEVGKSLSPEQKVAVAWFLTGRQPARQVVADPMANACRTAAPRFVVQASDWASWGRDSANTRYQPTPGLAAAELLRLKLKWSFAYPGSTVYGQPVAAGDRVFVSGHSGQAWSLDAATGCARWTYKAGAPARGGFVIAPLGNGRHGAFLGDDAAWLHALDAATGALLWKTRLDTHVSARITGAPAAHEGVLYVPLASLEEAIAIQPDYPCCTFRGQVVAVDARTGKVLWRGFTAEESKPFPDAKPGKARFGPAGAAIWTTPTIDAKAGAVYVTTGNSYTDASLPAANAVVAFDLRTGARRWVKQVTPNDNYILGCGFGYGKEGANCPRPAGPDVDFGAPAILRELPGGQRVLLAPQKSGVLWAIDPDRQGAVLWQRKLGQTTPAGGLVWGSAASPTEALAGYTGNLYPSPDAGPNGVAALDLASGALRWNTLNPDPAQCGWGTEKCAGVFMMPVSAIPGATVVGSMDGHLRAYDAQGKVIWDADTYGTTPGVNGAPATGGSLAQGGAILSGGRLFVNSGYGRFFGKAGNALLVYTVDGR